eukprot:8771005-Lingulodinium_polyedra.AAC.1
MRAFGGAEGPEDGLFGGGRHARIPKQPAVCRKGRGCLPQPAFELALCAPVRPGSAPAVFVGARD